MTASTTRSCARAEAAAAQTGGRSVRGFLARACAVFLLAAVALVARADGIAVQNAYLEVTDEGYFLNADFDLHLNPTLEEAVSRGVSLVFVVELEVSRPRRYWFSKEVASTRREYRLSYNALTRQYRLSLGGLAQSFGTLDEALQLLRRLRGWLVLEPDALERGSSYELELRFALDLSRLPKPIQVEALAGRDWHLEARHRLQIIQ